jgi:hypothetical protein
VTATDERHFAEYAWLFLGPPRLATCAPEPVLPDSLGRDEKRTAAVSPHFEVRQKCSSALCQVVGTAQKASKLSTLVTVVPVELLKLRAANLTFRRTHENQFGMPVGRSCVAHIEGPVCAPHYRSAFDGHRESA